MYSILRIDYDEFQPETYRAIYLQIDDGAFVFKSGSPNIDYNRAITTAFRRGYVPLISSSINNFMMDGGTLSED